MCRMKIKSEDQVASSFELPALRQMELTKEEVRGGSRQPLWNTPRP